MRLRAIGIEPLGGDVFGHPPIERRSLRIRQAIPRRVGQGPRRFHPHGANRIVEERRQQVGAKRRIRALEGGCRRAPHERIAVLQGGSNDVGGAAGDGAQSRECARPRDGGLVGVEGEVPQQTRRAGFARRPAAPNASANR